MATSSNRRDVELALRVTTLGEQGIGRLEQDIRALAAEGGAAAPEFTRLADEIARLGTQARTLDEFSRLGHEVRQLSDAQNLTAETASVLYGEMERLRASTGLLAQSERESKDALLAAQSALAEKKDALRSLRIETDEAGKKTEAYAVQVQELRRAQLEGERQVRALRDAHAAAKAATTAAAAAEGDLEKRYAASNRQAEQTARTLQERNAAFREAKGELAAAGVATDELASAQNHLVTALNAAGIEADQLRETQQRLIAETKRQAQEEERLATIVASSRRQMAEAARAEADGIIRDFDRMQAAEREAAKTAQEAAQTIASAFGTVGARSVQELEREIDKVRAAMRTLQTTAGISGAEVDRAMRLGNGRIKELERDIRAATGQLTLMDRAAFGLKSTIGQFAAGFGLVEVTQRLGTAFFDANKQIEGLRLGLGTIYKDSALTARQIEFLQQTSDRAGISVGSISESFVRFVASTRSANIPLAETNELFRAVTQAAGTLGLSGDKVSHILDALSQMAAKGTVSMEELRQQLGDSLPGALALTAKGLGITDQELIKLVESGGLLARDLFPALTKSLQSMSGEVNTLSAGWERFKNFLTQASQTMGDTGAVDALKGALIGLGGVVGAILIPLSGLLDTIFTGVRSVAVAVAALVSGDLKSLGPEVQRLWDDAMNRQANLSRAYQQLLGVADATGAANQQTAVSINRAGQAAAAAATNVTSNAMSHVAAGAAAVANAAGQDRAADAALRAGAQAALATQTIVQLGVVYAELSKTLANTTQVAEKAVKAREVEGQSLVAITKLTGDQRAELVASVDAAQGNMEALEALNKARQAEADALRNYIAQLAEEIRLRGDPDGSRQKDLAARQQKLDLLVAEAQRSKEASEAGRIEIAQRKLARQQYEDNSASLNLLREAMLNTSRTLQDYIALEKGGFATKEQVRAATLRAAEVEGLYRDALRDSAAAAERNIQVLQSKNLVTQAALQLDAERARSLGALAKTLGDENLATQANISGKQVEIKVRQANATAIAAEAAEMLRSAETQRAALIASGEFSAAKQAEYTRAVAGAEAKRLEAEAIRESTKTLEREISTLREGASAQDGYRGSVDRATGSIREQSKALEELYNRNRIVASQNTADGFKKNADGSAAGTFNNNLPVDQAFRLANGENMSLEEAKAAFEQAKAAFDDMQAFTRQSPGASSSEYQSSTQALFNATRAQFERISAAQNNTINAPANQLPAVANSNRTVTVQIGGKSTPIGVGSQQDSDNLVGVLRQLETASRSATA